MSKLVGLLLLSVLNIFAFGVLFGSSAGVFGDLVLIFDFTLKTKIINSLAIFGFLAVGLLLGTVIIRPRVLPELGAPVLVALLISFAFGFTSPDCVIFNFCGSASANAAQRCTTAFDKQGTYADCE